MTMMEMTRTSLYPDDERGRTHRLLYPASWTPGLNPLADVARRAAGAWFREIGVVGDERSMRILEEERPDLYGGFPYPTAGFSTLTTLTKYLALWMLFDDLVTETVADPSRAPDVGGYRQALLDGRLPEGADPFLFAWWKLGRELAERMSAPWCRRVQEYFVEWLEITVVERETYAALRARDRLPSVQQYFDIRTCSVGALPTFFFIEHVEGFELPERVLADERIRALHAIASKLVFVANDVLGLEKDLRSGWPNLVTVLAQERDVPLHVALEHVVDLHNRDMQRFVELERDLPSFGAAVDPFVRLYVERMHYVVCGFALFERQAERYRWKDLGNGAFRVALSFVQDA
jgi:hypothetical protein